MTLFVRKNCLLCDQLITNFNLSGMDVFLETMDEESAEILESIAWHTLIETSGPPLPLLVLDDATTVTEISEIRRHLEARAKLHQVDKHDSWYHHHPRAETTI
jgi:hypothetical protein